MPDLDSEDIPAFKKALAETTRSIAEDSELTVRYSADPPGMSDNVVRLPFLGPRTTAADLAVARGIADSLALRRKLHDTATHNKYLPVGETARDVYEALETARCEAIGAIRMPGSAANIDAKIADEAKQKGYREQTAIGEATLADALSYAVRRLATGRELPAAPKRIYELIRDDLQEKASETLGSLELVLSDQVEFARFARQLISDFGYAEQLGDDPDDSDQDDQQDGDEGDDEQPESEGSESSDSDEDMPADDSMLEESEQDDRQLFEGDPEDATSSEEQDDPDSRPTAGIAAREAFRRRPELHGLHHGVRRGDQGGGVGRTGRA